MKYLDILRGKLAELNEQRNAAIEAMEAATNAAAEESRSELNETETALFEEARSTVSSLDEQITATEARIGEFEAIESRSVTAANVPQVIRKNDPMDVLEDRSATPGQLADAVTRNLEGRVDADLMAHTRGLLNQHSHDTEWARSMLARSTPTYERAFGKLAANGGQLGGLTAEEQRAIVVGTNTAGGFLVPTVIDSTFIYTNSGSDNIIRQLATVITLTGAQNAVNPITTAGITASWDGELVEVSDDAPELARGAIPIHKAQAFVPYSLESEMDIPGLVANLRFALADAKDRLEGAAFATGSGSGQPKGLFTALDADTNVELTTTTAATVGEVDLHAVYRSLPARWRGRAVWIANPLFGLAIKRLGTAVGSSYTGDLREAPTDVVLGRPFYYAEDAPSTQTTTALDNVLAFGDPRTYVIADKPGSMVVEFVPHVFGATNSRPIGARALYAFWRTGADVSTTKAWRLLQDKTSA